MGSRESENGYRSAAAKEIGKMKLVKRGMGRRDSERKWLKERKRRMLWMKRRRDERDEGWEM